MPNQKIVRTGINVVQMVNFITHVALHIFLIDSFIFLPLIKQLSLKPTPGVMQTFFALSFKKECNSLCKQFQIRHGLEWNFIHFFQRFMWVVVRFSLFSTLFAFHPCISFMCLFFALFSTSALFIRSLLVHSFHTDFSHNTGIFHFSEHGITTELIDSGKFIMWMVFGCSRSFRGSRAFFLCLALDTVCFSLCIRIVWALDLYTA